MRRSRTLPPSSQNQRLPPQAIGPNGQSINPFLAPVTPPPPPPPSQPLGGPPTTSAISPAQKRAIDLVAARFVDNNKLMGQNKGEQALIDILACVKCKQLVPLGGPTDLIYKGCPRGHRLCGECWKVLEEPGRPILAKKTAATKEGRPLSPSSAELLGLLEFKCPRFTCSHRYQLADKTTYPVPLDFLLGVQTAYNNLCAHPMRCQWPTCGQIIDSPLMAAHLSECHHRPSPCGVPGCNVRASLETLVKTHIPTMHPDFFRLIPETAVIVKPNGSASVSTPLHNGVTVCTLQGHELALFVRMAAPIFTLTLKWVRAPSVTHAVPGRITVGLFNTKEQRFASSFLCAEYSSASLNDHLTISIPIAHLTSEMPLLITFIPESAFVVPLPKTSTKRKRDSEDVPEEAAKRARTMENDEVQMDTDAALLMFMNTMAMQGVDRNDEVDEFIRELDA